LNFFFKKKKKKEKERKNWGQLQTPPSGWNGGSSHPHFGQMGFGQLEVANPPSLFVCLFFLKNNNNLFSFFLFFFFVLGKWEHLGIFNHFL
jgi:hypothetical protein